MGCAGDPHVRTPHLDRLAARGLRFTDAYAPAPLCVPSRMAMLTARYPRDTGVHLNSHALPSSIPTLAHALRAGGYRSVLCGRMHFLGPDQRHGYQERLVGDHTPTQPGHPERDAGPFNGSFGQDRGCLAMCGAGWSSVQAYDTRVRDAAVARIEAQAGCAEPLFLTVGFYGPHNPYVCTRERYAHHLATLPRITQAELDAWQAADHPAVRAWRESRNLHHLTPDQIHRARAAYYGACETFDDHVGAVVEAAERVLGAGNVLTVYVSDHGDMAGERGLFWKSTFFEGSIGVPWILHAPGRIPVGVCDMPVSLLDLAPTLTALGNGRPLPGAEGIDRMPPVLGTSPWPERDILAVHADMRCGASAMVRRGSWKLVVHDGYDTPQLFDLAADPGERIDRGGEASEAGRIESMRAALEGVWEPGRVRGLIAEAAAQAAFFRAVPLDPDEPSERCAIDPATLHLEPEGGGGI